MEGGILVIRPTACHDLASADSNGLSDPYVVVVDKFRSKSKPNDYKDGNKTTVKKKARLAFSLFPCSALHHLGNGKHTLNPTWQGEEWQIWVADSNHTELLVEVWDWNRIHKDKPIGSCTLKLTDERLTSRGFPAKGKATNITLPLGEGNGTVDLELVPHWGVGPVSSWPEYTVKRQNAATLSIRVPNFLEIDGKASKDFRKTFFTKGERNKDKYLQCSLSISDTDDTEEAKQKYIDNALNEASRFEAMGVPFPQEFTGEKGEIQIAGSTGLQVTMHFDHSRLQNLDHKHAQCSTKCVFGAGGKLAYLVLETFSTQTRMSDTLAVHHQKMKALWTPVIDSVALVE